MGKLSVCGVLACATLIVTGCGGSDDGDALGAAAVAVTTTIPPADAVALAQSALLTLEEVGASWYAVPNSNDPIPFVDSNCGALERSLNDPLHLSSTAGVGYEMGEYAAVYHDVVVVGEHEARRAMDAFQSAESASCYTTAITDALEADPELDGTTVVVNVLPLSLETGGDVATNLITVTFTHEASGTKTAVTVRDSVMVSGRAYALFSTTDISKVDHDALMQKAMAKLDAVGTAT